MSEQKQQLIEDLKVLLEQEDVTAVKDQVEHIKTRFYKAGADEASEAGEMDEGVLAEGEQTDAQEQEFKQLLARYKEKRAAAAAKVAKEQADNLSRKQGILAEMKKLAESETDAAMSNLPRMRELQAEWKTIGAVPVEKVQETRKAYQQYQEQFYDMVKINIELRDLDFKKNLEMKTLLCEAAERLQNNENIVEAGRALQQLHDEWAEIGPVARELREDLWNRFKAASTVINKKHQAYFDELHAKEQENLERKRDIIERLQDINAPLANGENMTGKQFDEATEKIQALQDEWRTIGFAPKKYNQSIYEEYRAECDKFFHAKTAYYKSIRDSFSENLKRKRAIVAQAKELQESQDWNATADALRALQAEWRTIGPVARKYSDELWKEFTEACDTFFNAKRDAAKQQREERHQSARIAQSKTTNGGQNLYRLRDNLIQEIKTAENNILFFTAKSKGANKLLTDMQKKIDKLKAQLDEVKAQIKAGEDE